MKRQSQYYYEQQPTVNLQRSSFNRSHSYKTTFDSGYLIPFFCDEVLPGDTFNHSSHYFARLATPVFPIMDTIWLESFYFFVPNRLVWENWTKLMGDKPATDTTTYLVPTLKSSASTTPYDLAQGTYFDYMGLPTQVPNLEFNVLPFRAINLIYSRWFMEENREINLPVLRTGDSGDLFADFPKQYRSKKRDYFTAALPWPQKGDSVTIPSFGTSPVSTGPDQTLSGAHAALRWVYSSDSSAAANTVLTTLSTNTYSTDSGIGTQAAGLFPRNLYAFNDNSNEATINDLREAFQLQKFLERDARGGTRYIESIFSHFGVVNPDFRLQEPELLCVHKQTMNVNPVAQTSSTDATTPQGNLSAFATSSGSSHYIKSFTEHGFIIGFLNVRAELSYQQGLDRFWSRQSKFDYFWPEFAHLGEQAILNKEIYAQGDLILDINGDPIDENVFGYIPRFDDYRYKLSQVTGQMRSNATDSYDQWHLAQDFASLPELNDGFIADLSSPTTINRAMAVQDTAQILLDCYHNLNTVRVMPTYAVPGFADHF